MFGDWLIQEIYKTDPRGAIFAIVLVAVIFIVYKITSFYILTKERNKKVDNFDGLLKKIDTGLATLNNVLLEKEYIKSSCYSQANSPRIINPLGSEVLVKSGANKIYDKVKDEFLSDLENKEFDSLLELERQALNVFMDKMNDKRFKDIQNFAYRNPNFNNHPLGYIDILFLMALKLRDYYLKKHKDSGLG